jgi:hypothetical protein
MEILLTSFPKGLFSLKNSKKEPILFHIFNTSITKATNENVLKPNQSMFVSAKNRFI